MIKIILLESYHLWLQTRKPKTMPNGDFVEMNDVMFAQKCLSNINGFLLESMNKAEIMAFINLGISEDPGRDNAFMLFYKQYLARNLSEYINNHLTEEHFAQLHNSTINSEDENVILQIQEDLINMFPERLENGFNIRESIRQSIEYINTT